MEQIEMDMDRLPERLRTLEKIALRELSTKGMKTAGKKNIKDFTTERLKHEQRN